MFLYCVYYVYIACILCVYFNNLPENDRINDGNNNNNDQLEDEPLEDILSEEDDIIFDIFDDLNNESAD